MPATTTVRREVRAKIAEWLVNTSKAENAIAGEIASSVTTTTIQERRLARISGSLATLTDVLRLIDGGELND